MTRKTRAIFIGALAAASLSAAVLAGCGVKKYTFTNPGPEGFKEPDAGFVIDGVLNEAAYKNQRWLKGVKVEKNDDGLLYDNATAAISRAATFNMTSYFGQQGIYVGIEYTAEDGEMLYINPGRTYFYNSITELYFATPGITSINDVGACEIDMEPNDLLFKRRSPDGSFSIFATTNDIMAQLGVKFNGAVSESIPAGQKRATAYTAELFIPWEYVDKIGGEGSAAAIQNDGEIYLNAAPIRSFSYVDQDRVHWRMGSQLDNGDWGNVLGWYHFNKDGLVAHDIEIQKPQHGAVMERFGYDRAVANNSVTFLAKADEGYSFSDFKVNGVSYKSAIVYTDSNAGSMRGGYVTVPADVVTEALHIEAEFIPLPTAERVFSADVYEMRFGNKLALNGATVTLTGPETKSFTVTDGKIEGTMSAGRYKATLSGTNFEGYSEIGCVPFLGTDDDVVIVFSRPVFVQGNTTNAAKNTQIDTAHEHDEEGYITNISGNSFFPATRETFMDSVFTVNFKLSQATRNNRHFMRYIFEGTTVALQPSVRIYQGNLIVEWFPNKDWEISSLVTDWGTRTLPSKYLDAFNGSTGVNLTMARKGASFYVFVGLPGEQPTQYLSYTATGDYAAKPGHWAISVWDSAAGARVGFKLEEGTEAVDAWLTKTQTTKNAGTMSAILPSKKRVDIFENNEISGE